MLYAVVINDDLQGLKCMLKIKNKLNKMGSLLWQIINLDAMEVISRFWRRSLVHGVGNRKVQKVRAVHL
jgi:hypothetical protein